MASQARTASPQSSSSPPEPRSSWLLYVGAALVAGLVGGTIGYSFLGESLAVLGIPDPGIITTFGLPFLRAAAWLCAALAIGSFMFSAFYISPLPQRSTAKDSAEATHLGHAELSVDGLLAARTGAWAALAFAAIGIVMVPMVFSDTSGQTLVASLNVASWNLALEQVAASGVWLLSAMFAGAVGAAGLIQHRWSSQPALFLGAIVMIVPLGMEGHAATGGDHDYGTNAYLWHLVFMAIWIGGLMALIAHGRRLGPELEVAVRRYSSVALFSLLAVAASGVISALIRIEITDLFTTRYGLIIVAKIVGTVGLALLGFAHRSITIPRLATQPSAFLRLAVGEVVLMAVVAGVAVTMGRTPPPPPRDPNLTSMDIQIGYELTKEPTFFGVFTVWRFDVMFGAIAVLLAGFYLAGVRSVKRQGKPWKRSYTLWWLAGCASLLVTTSSGIGLYMPAAYSMHMVGHMVLSMVVPLVMTLGAPLTLVMTVWDAGEPGKATPHDWANAFIHSRFLRVVTTPWVNLLQFLVFFYVLYLSIPLYELAISEHAGHLLMNWSFILSGYFYFWELVGPDRIPHRRPASIRLFWLAVAMPVHLFFGVYLMQLNVVMGEEFYRSLELPWNPDLLQDQKEGGGIAWAFGSFPITYVMAVLLLEWRRDDAAEGRRVDARLDAAERERSAESVEKRGEAATDSEELDEFSAYNEMLRRYHEGSGSQLDDYYGAEFTQR
ncbi:cytochrome c oxidase assembly protein [Corynebacterium uterequi]|uniref:Putative membrane protein n=1 Tax=Corynebacterium uterequi TaxID=1072256 RepID=A0A0G3HIF7_9CORY|nr:cytochrome c oxidase assembly protein [Corynebacterium uterequi]AKK11688.1 putative membrane protein [Corynebacterium uterequi]